MLALKTVRGEPPSLNNASRSVATTSKEELQLFARDPLLYISRWYNGYTVEEGAIEGACPPDEGGVVSEVVPVGFHDSAENYKSSLRAGTASIARHQGGVEFVNLPVGVHLHLFSFLDATSLCHLSQTCHHLRSVASDPLLWKRLLERDLNQWPVVGHLSLPAVYHEASTDLTPKEIYANCYTNRTALPQVSFTRPITGRLRSLVRRIQGHIPHVVMFGSGLESVPLVRTLLWESPYRPVGLYPGKDGVGSGVCIQHRGSPVNLIALYTATRAERRAAAAGQRARVNKLVHETQEDSSNEPELTQSVQGVCGGADAFILVVDPANLNSEAVQLNQAMLSAMLRTRDPRTPVLVLSCLQDTHTHMLSPAEVAKQLKLSELTRPWQVRELRVATCEGIQDGFDWLLGASSV